MKSFFVLFVLLFATQLLADIAGGLAHDCILMIGSGIAAIVMMIMDGYKREKGNG